MSHMNQAAHCTCGEIRLGREPSGSFNWNPDCHEHGTKSLWWRSPEQVAQRKIDDRRLRITQTKARHARQLGIGCSTGEIIEEEGECTVCDLTRFELGEESVE